MTDRSDALPEDAGRRYRIASKIAAGGMGEVYYATMTTLAGVEKPVALKLVRADHEGRADFERLFFEEARVAMSLSHANIVHAFDVGRLDDRLFIAMEYVEGLDLGDLHRRHLRARGAVLPRRVVLHVLVEVLKGLDHAHRRRAPTGELLEIVHRDVSPGNVLVSFEGEVKIADFGIAKSALRSGTSMERTVAGKLPYMAPEQLRGELVDRRADLYSVGAVAYELFAGRRPFDDDAGTAVIPKILAGEVTNLRALVPDLPPDLASLVERAMARDPTDRPPTAAALRQELERVATSLGETATSADIADLVAELTAKGPGEPVARPRTRTLTPAPATTSAAPPPAAENPFDAILGRELERVASTDTFSVELPTARPTAARPLVAEGHAAAPANPSSRSGRAAVAALAVVALGATALWAALRSNGTDGASRASAHDASHLAPLDASEPGPLPTPPAEAASLDPSVPVPTSTPQTTPPAPSPDPGRAQSARPLDSARPRGVSRGVLSVNTDPWSEVSIDGVVVGPTPLLGHELPAGTHVLVFRNRSRGIERTLRVELARDEHRRISLDLASP